MSQASAVELLKSYEKHIAICVVLVPALGAVIATYQVISGHAGFFELFLLILFYWLSMTGIEVGFHRLTSHKAFQCKPWLHRLFIALGSMALQGPVIFWAATHRKHHAFEDGAGDPHSPYYPAPRLSRERVAFSGLLHAHVGWLFQNTPANWTHYAADLLKDRHIFRDHQLYPAYALAGLSLPSFMGLVYYGTWEGFLSGLIWGGLLRVFLVHHAVWAVNSLCHVYGNRDYVTRGCSVNNPWLAIPTLGGSWHNNHHAFPTTAINSFKRNQIDLSGALIKLLEKGGLIWNVQFPSFAVRQKKLSPSPSSIDCG